MGTKSVLLTCMALLTATVVLSVGRIEYLNAVGGHVLPRSERFGQRSVFDIAELDAVLNHMDQKFYDRRIVSAEADAYENGGTEPAAVSRGAPYSKSEQRSIDYVTLQHEVLTKLHWWIKNLGWAQYFIAPIALLASISCGLASKGWPIKALAVTCASLCCYCIFVILVRGYWAAA
jgi:hypothetical protein